MLKKFLLILVGFVLAVAIFSVAGFAYAQTQTTPETEYLCPYCGTTEGYVDRGRGMRGGGFGSGMWGTTDDDYGPMHETILAAFADVLGLSVEELATRHDTGETMFEIAQSQGLTLEEFSVLLFETRIVALEQAVEDGLLTREQADWMLDHWEAMQANGYGSSSGLGTGPCQDGDFSNSRGGRGGGRWSGNQ